MMIDANKIEQVFTNVILNALDAMPDGGVLSIASQNSADNKEVIVIFTDTGCGIPDEKLDKIFDPFFTTKGTKGTGLGLAVSFGIIEQHEGKISVESNIDEGTVFKIQIPVKSMKSTKREEHVL